MARDGLDTLTGKPVGVVENERVSMVRHLELVAAKDAEIERLQSGLREMIEDKDGLRHPNHFRRRAAVLLKQPSPD